MNDNINWLGNKVVDSNSPYQSRGSVNNSTFPNQTPYVPLPVANDYTNPYQSQLVNPTVVSQPTQPTQPPEPPEIPEVMQGPPPSTMVGYIPYYLTQNIGKSIRAEFIIGNDQYADKTGILIEVGINYFVLNDVGSRTHIMCDLYSVKFVTVLLS